MLVYRVFILFIAFSFCFSVLATDEETEDVTIESFPETEQFEGDYSEETPVYERLVSQLQSESPDSFAFQLGADMVLIYQYLQQLREQDKDAKNLIAKVFDDYAKSGESQDLRTRNKYLKNQIKQTPVRAFQFPVFNKMIDEMLAIERYGVINLSGELRLALRHQLREFFQVTKKLEKKNPELMEMRQTLAEDIPKDLHNMVLMVYFEKVLAMATQLPAVKYRPVLLKDFPNESLSSFQRLESGVDENGIFVVKYQ